MSGRPSSFKPALSPSSSLPVFQCTLCSSSRVSAVPARFGDSWCSCRCTSTQAYPRPNVNEAKNRPGRRPGQDSDLARNLARNLATSAKSPRQHSLAHNPTNFFSRSPPFALLYSFIFTSSHRSSCYILTPPPPKSEYTHFEGPTPSLSYVHLRRRAATLTNPTGRHQPRPFHPAYQKHDDPGLDVYDIPVALPPTSNLSYSPGATGASVV